MKNCITYGVQQYEVPYSFPWDFLPLMCVFPRVSYFVSLRRRGLKICKKTISVVTALENEIYIFLLRFLSISNYNQFHLSREFPLPRETGTFDK